MFSGLSQARVDKMSKRSREFFSLLYLQKRLLSIAAVDKWVLDHDKTLNTATWLTHEKADRRDVTLL